MYTCGYVRSSARCAPPRSLPLNPDASPSEVSAWRYSTRSLPNSPLATSIHRPPVPLASTVDMDLTTANKLALGVRGLQLVCCAVTLGVLVTSSTSGDAYYSVHLTTPAVTFSVLMAYTGALHSLVAFVAVYSRAPALNVSVGDALLVLLLVVAGIVVATSNYVKDCESSETYYLFDGDVHCANLKAGSALMFVSMGLFLVSFAILFVMDHAEDFALATEADADADVAPYLDETTPSTSARPPDGQDNTDAPTQRSV